MKGKKRNKQNKTVSLSGTKSEKKCKPYVDAIKDENWKEKVVGKVSSITSSIPSKLTCNKVQMKLLVVSSKDMLKNHPKTTRTNQISIKERRRNTSL